MVSASSPSQREKDYAFRRVVYDVLIAARSVIEFPQVNRDFSKKESLKVAALITARNLNAFLYLTDDGHCDDIHVGVFALPAWTADSSAALGKPHKTRINKLVGHVVTSRPGPFKNDQEVVDLVVPLIRESCEFISKCRQSGAARYSGAATSYVGQLNMGLGVTPTVLGTVAHLAAQTDNLQPSKRA